MANSCGRIRLLELDYALLADNHMHFEKTILAVLLGSGRGGASDSGIPSDYALGTGFYQIHSTVNRGRLSSNPLLEEYGTSGVKHDQD